jgi:hypothetical protein
MLRKIDLKPGNTLYNNLANELDPFKDKKPLSVKFIVEGTLEKPIILIKYPGKKCLKLKPKRKGACEYANLYDFVVVILNEGKEEISQFTFENILNDFEENKKMNEEFWKILANLYYKNEIMKDPPELKGINSKLFLLALKWIWIQEDLNYRLRCEDITAPTRYKLLSKKGKPMSRGAGRAKFFAALILLKNDFTLDEVKKIISMYA